MRIKTITILLTLHCLFNVYSQSKKPFKVHTIFQDNMVLQRGVEVPLWGWSTSGDIVKVFVNGKLSKETICNSNGIWEVQLSKFKEEERYTITIKSEKYDQIKIKNIVIGDVWICSGQSNMAFQLYRSLKGKKAIENSQNNNIRHIKINTAYSEEEISKFPKENWEVSSPETSPNFTAVGYYFANEILKQKSINIGLINASIGGSRIETWMSKQNFSSSYIKSNRDSLKAVDNAYEKTILNKIGYIPKEVNNDEFFKNIWDYKNLEIPLWVNQKLPGRWEDKGYHFLNGEVYYVKDFFIKIIADIPDEVLLSLGTIDDADVTWVNGYIVGETKLWNEPRKYKFSKTILKLGLNRILIKVIDNKGSGGVRGNKTNMFINLGENIVNLSGQWKFHIVKLDIDNPYKLRYRPTLAYNAMIHPLIKFPIKGVLWYQGENNARNIKDALNYKEQFQSLINDWRNKLNKVDSLPFLFVQLSNYDSKVSEKNSWAILRDAQIEALTLPNTGCAVTIDIGNRNDIHPKNKYEVGRRLAFIALNKVYGDKSRSDKGPSLAKVKFEKSYVNISFKDVVNGLISKNGSQFIKGFQLIDREGNVLKSIAKIITKNKVSVKT